MFKGFDNLDPLLFFELNNAPTRGHSLKLVKPRRRLDVRKYSFAHRVVDVWNSLDENVIACDSFNGLKIYSTNVCMVKGSYELLSLINYYFILTVIVRRCILLAILSART